MKFVRYNGNTAVIAMNGNELSDEHPESDLSDHLGLWFGEVTEDGRPIVYTIPAEYVEQAEVMLPECRH
jgi:hypothetical protein